MAKIDKKGKVKSANNPSRSKIKLKSADEISEFAENIINTVREPLLVLDKDLRVVKASRSFYDFFKVSSNETIGTLIYDLGNHQWDIPKLRELLETILPEKTTFDNYEVEHNFSTIGKRIMLLNARQIERALGKEKIILLAIEDITERKHTEESVSETSHMTNEYLDILFNHAHAPIIIWNVSFVITHINYAFEKLSGYDWTEVRDKKIDILFPKDKIDSTLELITNTLLSDERPELIEIDLLTKDKDIKTVLWNSANIFDKEGKHIVATIAQDITKRKRTEEALTILETRYRRLFESAKDGILILNSETGKIIDVNPFLIELLGYSKEQFIEKEIWEIGFFKDIVANHDKFLELQQKEYIRYDDLPLETADGRKINVEFVSNVYLVNHRKVIQCNIRDITERKRKEKELIVAKERAEQSDKLKSEFLAQMSHEIRTPFNIILSSVQLLKSEKHVLDSEEIKQLFSTLEQGSNRIIRTIDEMMEMSKIRSGSYEIHLETIELEKNIISQVIKSYKDIAERKGVLLTYEKTTDINEIKCDKFMIYQIIQEIVDNAVKFTKKGTINIKQFKNTDGKLCVSVADTGIGISKEYLEHIFEPFTQEDTGYSRKFEGNGLGLALVKKYCDINNAIIEVESEKNIGSTFRVTFKS